MGQSSDVPGLEEAMERVTRDAQEHSRTGGLSTPYLHCFTDDGALVVAAMAGPGGAAMGTAARAVVASLDAAVAIFAAQAWASQTRPGERPTSASARQEILMLYGEDRAGNEIARLWWIRAPRKGGARTFEPIETAGNQRWASHIRPLFMFRQFVQEGYPEVEARAMAKQAAERSGVPSALSGLPRPTPN